MSRLKSALAVGAMVAGLALTATTASFGARICSRAGSVSCAAMLKTITPSYSGVSAQPEEAQTQALTGEDASVFVILGLIFLFAIVAIVAKGGRGGYLVTGGGSDANAFQSAGLPCANLADGTERNHEP